MEEIKQNQDQKDSGKKTERIYGNDKISLFIAFLFVGLLAVLLFSLNNQQGEKQKKYADNPGDQVYPNVSGGAGNQDGGITQVNGDQASGVEVTAVYEKDKSQNQTFFKLYFNTHAADYSNYDFQSNVVIKDSQSKVYKSANITKEGSGHHQSIEITFPLTLSPFKLVVKNLADVPEREFSF